MTRIQLFKDFAISLAKLSKCTKLGVGAIITDGSLSTVHSIGVNGGPKGIVNGPYGPITCLCNAEGKYGCVHAEVNALIKDRSNEPGKVMFVTLSPCVQCAASIINAPGGFSKVYYIDEWKSDEGIKLLRAAGIHVERI